MRILNIFFKNINSLEGEGRIYFDRGPIADSGVFAITGPNGSGKTSILDVITLGLYGETFRFDKPAAHVITKQTTESFAEVEFALGDERFRSSWRVRRADDSQQADALSPEMTLTRLFGDSEDKLAESPTAVRNHIAELTGMDFHKFSKSMVLPQGDFAAFLNALDSERMDILEKISGNNLYAEYRQQAESQFSQAQTRLNQLQQDIASIPLLSEESMQAATFDLQDFHDRVAELKQYRQQATQQLSSIRNVEELKRRQHQLEQGRTDLLERISRHEQALQRIADHQAAIRYRDDLTALDAKQTQVDQALATLATYRRELEMLQQQLGSDVPSLIPDKSLLEQKQAIDGLKLTVSEIKLELPRQTELAQSIQQQIADNQTALLEIDNWFNAHAADSALMDHFPDVIRLRNLRTELVELGGKQKVQTNWTKSTTSALKKNQAALADTQSALTELQAKIVADQERLDVLAQGKSFDELKEFLQEQQQRVSDLQELNSIAEVTGRFTKKGWFSWFGASKQDDMPDEDELQATLDAVRAEMSREENIIKVLEQAIRNEAMVRKMASDRAKLVEGQPCFLCGSLAHPYVVKPPVATDSKKALVDQRGKIQALKSRIDNLSSQLKVAQKRNSQLSAKQKRLQQMHSQWTLLANRLNIMYSGLEIGNLSRQKQLLAEETEELNKISQLVKDHGQLQRNIAKAKSDVEGKQLQLEKLTQVVSELEVAWNNRPPEYAEIEQRFAACGTEEKALAAMLEKQLSELGEKMPSKGKENPLFDRLNSRRQDYQIYVLRQKGLQDEISALSEKLGLCQATISDYQQRMSASLEALSEQERLGLHIAVIEKQKLIADQEQGLQIAKIEHQAMHRHLSEQLGVTEFATLEGLRDILALIDSQPDIERQYQDDKTRLAELETENVGLAGSIETELAAIDATVALEQLEATLAQVDAQLDIAEQEIRTLDNKLDKQQQYRERYQALALQLEEQQRAFDQAEAEIRVINDDSGGLRRRIQQLMIDKLLSQTNRNLEKLSGRYYVRGSASEHGLKLEIEDTKQRNVHRLPQTLSGGESFLVSLALALALAENANNGKAIDSLFLDEGFGNLDAESLYLAMTTLEGLKTQGKIVGVISHVDGVKKRIKTQIELVKKANGLSELKMVA